MYKSQLLSFVIVLSLAGCKVEPKDLPSKYQLPEELSDCTIHQITSTEMGRSDLTVVRCPLSQTTTYRRQNKIHHISQVVERGEF